MGEQREALQSVGIERVIPMRFMQLRRKATDPDCLDEARLADGVRMMNEVYRPAGVQFVAEVASYHAPNLYYSGWFALPYYAPQAPASTGSIANDIATIYPACTPPASTPEWNLTTWAAWASLACHPPASIPVWVPCHDNAHGSWAHGPDQGRAVHIVRSAAYEPARLAHEVGHYLGLAHINAANTSFDSRNQTETGFAAAWDLFYQPGSSPSHPHVFPTSGTAAADILALGGSLWPVLNCTDGPCYPQCGNTADGRLYCWLPGLNGYSEYHDHWSPALQRGLTFGTGLPSTSGPWGANAMSYFNQGAPPQGSQEQPASFSPSQIALIRRNLRYATRVVQNQDFTIPQEFLGLPSKRPSLGQHLHRAPAYDLDFDADGLRDLATYRPAHAGGGTSGGRFIVRLSSNGATFQVLLGADPSAIPLVADIDGDGRTDAVVYEIDPATDLGHFRWCPTPSTPWGTFDCAASPTLRDSSASSFATRGDVPFVFKNGGSRAFAAYRPSTCTFLRHSNDGQGTTKVTQMAYTAPDTCTGTAEPIVDLFDGDEISDFATYEPANVKFRLKTSGTSWAQVVRSFPGYYTPSSVGSPYQRSGAVVVRGMADRPTVASGLRERRAALALWQPELGYVTTLYSPHNNAASTTCFNAGPGGGRPMGGVGTRLHAEWGGANAQTSFAVLDQPSMASSPDGLLKIAPPGCAPVTTVNLGYTPLGVTVEPIGDINGDDLPELLWVQSTGPYAGTPYWFLSPSYTTYDSAWVPMAQPWDIWLLPRSST
ncbi:MAG: VCBS repeat-containing protein [Polyangiaceae bacterium]|nr:VCBS repeat-containing protein [Polyangiaceae bacterium]